MIYGIIGFSGRADAFDGTQVAEIIDSLGALGLGGILNSTGLLQPLFDGLTRGIKSAKGVMVMAWLLTLICILVISTNNFYFVLVNTLFAPIFEKYHLKSQNLSRILEDVGITDSVLIPRNVGPCSWWARRSSPWPLP